MVGISRRSVSLGMLAVALVPSIASAAQNGSQIARNHLIQSIPVLPWLKIGETTMTQVRPPIQQMITTYGGALLVKEGDSVETGGTFINLASAKESGLLNEQGLRVLTLDFDQSQRAQMAVFMVNRGWKDKNIEPLVSRMVRRYSNLATPVSITDPNSEASDKTILFPIGKFVIEIQLPQHGTFATVTFTTKAILARLRTIDGTLHLLKDHLLV